MIGLVIAAISYYLNTEGHFTRKELVVGLVIIWGLRLSIHLGWCNRGKEEGYRYQQFRKIMVPSAISGLVFSSVFITRGIMLVGICSFISCHVLYAIYFAQLYRLSSDNHLDY